MARVLYQFPISHYCEKTRWHLDAKGLEYRSTDLIPGTHLLVGRRYGVRGTVPLLVDGDRVLGDSTEIALHLEREYPTPSLLPEDGPARARALELEELFDEQLGPHVRRYFYGAAMEERPGGAAAALMAAYSLPVRLLGKLAAARLEGVLRRQYGISPDTIRSSRAGIVAAIDRLERETGGDPDRYLVGDRLTVADITAAALLAPLADPPGSPWAGTPIPAEVQVLRDEVRARAAGRWVARRYERDRRLGGRPGATPSDPRASRVASPAGRRPG